jgi:hypothetical protein
MLATLVGLGLIFSQRAGHAQVLGVTVVHLGPSAGLQSVQVVTAGSPNYVRCVSPGMVPIVNERDPYYSHNIEGDKLAGTSVDAKINLPLAQMLGGAAAWGMYIRPVLHYWGRLANGRSGWIRFRVGDRFKAVNGGITFVNLDDPTRPGRPALHVWWGDFGLNVVYRFKVDSRYSYRISYDYSTTESNGWWSFDPPNSWYSSGTPSFPYFDKPANYCF